MYADNATNVGAIILIKNKLYRFVIFILFAIYNDKTLYILAIVILAIFCILLIKKVLNI